MYESKAIVSIVDADYLRQYLRIDDDSEDAFLEELGRAATENLEHRLKRHVIARNSSDSEAVCTDKESVPAALRVWVGASVAFVYTNRESDSEKSFTSTPYFERLIDPWRAYK